MCAVYCFGAGSLWHFWQAFSRCQLYLPAAKAGGAEDAASIGAILKAMRFSAVHYADGCS
ncbi:hypothetical protein CHU92_11295 [Flavobacterium cyanobacteriorum]|uniref:Uncharacterized protein n=1 Tax=Flavobacterium cyanobacteriorum TaxID=2022802 RepID=A0A255Z0L9_9FLAO|nr:hypothetical protein CHU92_11295 [Flavobacterium cyanobacteriorum]